MKIGFVKYGGMGSGGTERWLQEAAIILSKNGFEIDFYYSRDSIDSGRLQYMKNYNVNLIEFKVGRRELNKTEDWVETDFWEFFNEEKYDFIQTAKYCKAEYPFYKFNVPFIQMASFATELDNSENLYHTFLPSEWLRNKWIKLGGAKNLCSVLPTPIQDPKSADNLRNKLGIPHDYIIAGFHQRVSDEIFSYIPLLCFKLISKPNRVFIVMGGSKRYKQQAKLLKLKNVYFLNHTSNWSNISCFLNTLDFYAHGRKDGETYGAVLAEALIHGLPCITHKSSEDNAQKQTIGPHGFFCNNFIDYTLKLNLLYKNQKLRKRLSKNSKIFARTKYGYKNFESGIISFYSSLVK